MPAEPTTKFAEALEVDQAGLLDEWIELQLAAVTLRSDLIKEGELREQSGRFLKLLREAARSGNLTAIDAPGWAAMRELLDEISSDRTRQGFTPSETATFVFSVKQPLFARLRQQHATTEGLADDLWHATVVLDKLGLYTMEAHQKTREQIISRQQEEMYELSSPVVQLWEGVLGLPLIGTLDSKRAQLVMEALLERLSETQSEVAVIDVTGVPTVDTMTAQHLLKTVSAAQLMGARCIISGIRPEIAQIMVHLGVSLGDVVTKATMAGALAHAFKQQGLVVVPLSRTGGNG